MDQRAGKIWQGINISEDWTAKAVVKSACESWRYLAIDHGLPILGHSGGMSFSVVTGVKTGFGEVGNCRQ